MIQKSFINAACRQDDLLATRGLDAVMHIRTLKLMIVILLITAVIGCCKCFLKRQFIHELIDLTAVIVPLNATAKDFASAVNGTEGNSNQQHG